MLNFLQTVVSKHHRYADPNLFTFIYEVVMNYKFMFYTLLTIFTVSLALSQPGPGRGMMKDLNLSDAQKEQFEKITFDMQKKQIEVKAKLETAKLELRRLIGADNLDKAAIEKKMNEIASQQVTLRMNHINAWSEKNKALNADQQKIWKKILNKHPRMMQKQMHGQMMRKHAMPMDDDMDDDDAPRMERKIKKRIIKE